MGLNGYDPDTYKELHELVHGETCEICGFIFMDITPEDTISAHTLRCIDSKVDAAKWHLANGHRETVFGWVRQDGSLC